MTKPDFKSPAFQFYPNDFLGSAKVAAMTLEEVGLYTLLLCYDWNENGLPESPEVLAKLLRISPRTFKKLWRTVGENFTKRGNRYYNKRLEAERRKQLDRKQKAADAANTRWHPPELEPDASALPEAMPPQSPSVPVATPVAVASPVSTTSGAIKDTEPPRVSLPAEADRFLGMFYEPALTEPARKRYRDVKAQLYDVLDPQHPGPTIRGGVRVKARSVQHLADTLKSVMADPPMDRDKAIVFVLKRLTNREKGPSETEVLKRTESAVIAEDERYSEASRQAGLQWAKDHPEEFEKIQRKVDASLAGVEGAFVKMARDTQLAQLTAREAQFPPFEKWQEQQRRIA